METVVFCSSELRREKVRAQGTLNGVDYLEVDHPAQRTLTVTFLKPVAGLGPTNFRVEGGVRVGGIRVVEVTPGADANVLLVLVDQRGDFSDYVLRVVAGPGSDDPPAGFDRRLSEVVFNFKVLCPSDFDCAPPRDCPPETPETAEIDYLAKDFATFRRLMLDRMTVTAPAWRERNPADMTVALVEVLAYVADHLSYFQDSVATEAYLGTARRRTSVRRHARLLDYAMHEGANARAFVCLEVAKGSPADGALLPKGTPFLDASLGEGARADVDLTVPMPLVFEAMHGVALAAARSGIRFHTWSDEDCCLPKGATRATLRREAGLVLRPGDLVAFYEVPLYGADHLAREADPRHRHVVRLRTVDALRDDFEGVDLYDVSWSPEDALPFALCLSDEIDGERFEIAALACANVVLADHGQTLPAQPPIPARPESSDVGYKYRPTLASTDLTFAAPYDPEASAAALLRVDPHAATASVVLTSGGRRWAVRSDLLSATPFDPYFVVETETDRSVRLRFGDDLNGMAPNPDDAFSAAVRIGGGTAGNVGHDVLVRVALPLDGIENVFNPLPGSGGVEPEPIEEVRQFAPEAYKVQERAVTEEDYATMAERHPEVQAARAQFRWTGSWCTVFLAVDRRGGEPMDDAFRKGMTAHMDRYRMAGVDVDLREPQFVPLEIVLKVCVANGYFQSDVHRRLLQAFHAFFDPDRFTFGEDVYLSEVLSVAMGVVGVDHVVAETFKRWAQTPNEELAIGRIAIAGSEIARLSNDPSRPEDGRIRFDLEGGL